MSKAGAARPPRRRPQVTVIGDGDAGPVLTRRAEEVGALLARLGAVTITGGRGGVMEAACRGARRAGGLTVGILPSAEPAAGNPWCDVLVRSELGHARNALTALSGDVVVALGGGAGTLSELAFAWIHGRPILLLDGTGGWADALADRPLDGRGSSTITRCAGLDALEAALRRLLPAGRPRRP